LEPFWNRGRHAPLRRHAYQTILRRLALQLARARAVPLSYRSVMLRSNLAVYLAAF
jgi:hypothetical protein